MGSRVVDPLLDGARWWGRGYAREAARATLDEAFGPLAWSGVIAVTRPENHRSQRVLERLGFTLTGMRLAYGHRQRCYELAAGG